MKHFCNAFAVLLAAICTASTASALPLVWRADWPDAKPVETLVHRGTDIELQPLWRINKEPADTNGWTFTTFCQTNAVGPWFGPLPGAFFSHTNDVGAAFYNVMVRAQTPGGAVNYTAFARIRMLDSPGFTPGKLPLPVSTIDFSRVVALHAPWTLQTDFSAATNTLSVAIDGLAQDLATVSNAAVNAAITNALQDAALTDHIKGATNPHKVTAEQVGALSISRRADSDQTFDWCQTEASGSIRLFGTHYKTGIGLGLWSGGGELLNYHDDTSDRYQFPAGESGTLALQKHISATNPTFSNAVLAVGLNIDTNSVAVFNELAETFGGFPIEGTATTVGGLLAALAAAVAWLKKNKLDKTDVVAPSASAEGKAADAKAVGEALSGKVDNVRGRIEEQLFVGKAAEATIIVGGSIRHQMIEDGGAFIWFLGLPHKSGTFALTSDIEDAVKNKADRASLAPEYSPTSAYSVGSIVYYYGNIYQCKTEIAAGGEEWNAAHWELMKLDDFFTESNSLLTATIDARLPYPLYAVTDETGLLKDRAINTTSLASVTIPDNFTDLLIRASVASSLSVTMPEAITTKYGDTFPGEAGEYLITITKTGAAEAYVRTIKLEEVA